MSEKKPVTPTKNSWLKNTYFWIAAVLFILGVVGLIGGDPVIRDPGQRHEDKLWAIYFAASVVMLVNGLISHKIWLSSFPEISLNDKDSN
ncbi:MAG: hypothetical protein GC165_02700 [Armatimonadetes bacterium]|nr:hypothetical protein [Armatimonadota bacterium]